jgi:hypothetical protein
VSAVRGSIRVAAESEVVLGILLNVAAYPSWQREIDRVDVVARDERGRPARTRVWIKALGRAGSYTVAYRYPRTGEIEYHLVEADMMTRHDARFVVADDGAASELSVELDIALKWPVPAPLLNVLVRKGVNDMLDAVKSQAEKRT